MKKLSPFGKFVRSHRIYQDKTLDEMARYIKVSSTFLSSVEHGNRNVNDKILDGAIEFLDLLGPQIAEIEEAAFASGKKFTLVPVQDDLDKRMVIGRLVRAINKNKLSDQDWKNLAVIVND